MFRPRNKEIAKLLLLRLQKSKRTESVWLPKVHPANILACILGQLKWESLKKRRKDNRLILLYKGLKGKARIPIDDLIPRLGVTGISTPWPFRYPQPVKMSKSTFTSTSLRCSVTN